MKKLIVFTLILLFVLVSVGCNTSSYKAPEDVIENQYTFNNKGFQKYFWMYKDKIFYERTASPVVGLYYADESGTHKMVGTYDSVFESDNAELYGEFVTYDDKCYFLGTCDEGIMVYRYDWDNDNCIKVALIKEDSNIANWAVFENKIFYYTVDGKFAYYDIESEKFTDIGTSIVCFSITKNNSLLYVDYVNGTYTVYSYNVKEGNSAVIYNAEETVDDLFFYTFFLTDEYFIVNDGENSFDIHNLKNGDIKTIKASFFVSNFVLYDKCMFISGSETLNGDVNSIHRLDLSSGIFETVKNDLVDICQLYAVSDDTVYALTSDGKNIGGKMNIHRITAKGEMESVFSYNP